MLDEAEVVHQDQPRAFRVAAAQRLDADVDRAGGGLEQGPARLAQPCRLRAVEFGREGPCGPGEPMIGRAQPQREEALVEDGALEEGVDAGGVAGGERIGERVGEGVGDKVAAKVEVAGEPPHRQPVHQGQRQVGGRHQHQGERQEKAELEPERRSHHCVAAASRRSGWRDARAGRLRARGAAAT